MGKSKEQAGEMREPKVQDAVLGSSEEVLSEDLPYHGRHFVYLMRLANGWWKIGMARKVPSRIREVEKNTQYATEQVFQIQCPSWSAALDLERELHGKFKSKRVKSEWFSLDHRDIVEIEDQHKATEVDLSQGAPILVRCYAGEKRLAENLTKCPNVKVIVTVRVPEEWTGVLKGGKWLSWNVREAIKWWMNKRTERV